MKRTWLTFQALFCASCRWHVFPEIFSAAIIAQGRASYCGQNTSCEEWFPWDHVVHGVYNISTKALMETMQNISMASKQWLNSVMHNVWKTPTKMRWETMSLNNLSHIVGQVFFGLHRCFFVRSHYARSKTASRSTPKSEPHHALLAPQEVVLCLAQAGIVIETMHSQSLRSRMGAAGLPRSLNIAEQNITVGETQQHSLTWTGINSLT